MDTMRIFILLGLLSATLALPYCPDKLVIPENCICEHFDAGGDEDRGTTIFACTLINQATFEKLMADLNGYHFNQLQLVECTFTKLHDKAFENITIGLLDIEDTPIVEVAREAFADIPHLMEISIRNTSITRIPHFKHISHSLMEMVLNNNNIKKLDKDEFVDLTNLQVIMLEGNNIQEIDDGVFHGLFNLVEVDLEMNNISIVGDWFEKNSTLNILDLRDNFISELPETFFPSLPQLHVLYLSDNNFKDLPAKTFKAYVEYKEDVDIEIWNNPLVCDTRLCWLFNYLDSVRDIDVHGRCEEPGAYSGRHLEDIGDDEVYCPGFKFYY